MAQNFWLAAFAFIVCFTLTLVISLATKSQKADADLKGLVYSLTPKIVDHNIPIYQKPACRRRRAAPTNRCRRSRSPCRQKGKRSIRRFPFRLAQFLWAGHICKTADVTAT